MAAITPSHITDALDTDSLLVRSILDNPDDDTARLVYADFLDETGKPYRAEFIRVQVELARTPERVVVEQMYDVPQREFSGRVNQRSSGSSGTSAVYELTGHVPGVGNVGTVTYYGENPHWRKLKNRESDLKGFRWTWNEKPLTDAADGLFWDADTRWVNSRSPETDHFYPGYAAAIAYQRGFIEAVRVRRFSDLYRPASLTMVRSDSHTFAQALFSRCPIRRVSFDDRVPAVVTGLRYGGRCRSWYRRDDAGESAASIPDSVLGGTGYRLDFAEGDWASTYLCERFVNWGRTLVGLKQFPLTVRPTET